VNKVGVLHSNNGSEAVWGNSAGEQPIEQEAVLIYASATRSLSGSRVAEMDVSVVLESESEDARTDFWSANLRLTASTNFWYVICPRSPDSASRNVSKKVVVKSPPRPLFSLASVSELVPAISICEGWPVKTSGNIRELIVDIEVQSATHQLSVSVSVQDLSLSRSAF
jgi:hypothetical protein